MDKILLHVHTMRDYLVLKRNEISSCENTRRNFKKHIAKDSNYMRKFSVEKARL